jgi:YD repeat-containing protein
VHRAHCIIRVVAADRTASVRRDAAGRLAGETDRHGAPVSELAWTDDGRLRHAAVRIPDGSWVSVAPGAGPPGPWGASDALRHEARLVTCFAAVDWTRVDRIPPLAEPARLPPGAGTAVLNLIARLAVQQGVGALHYDGPYPTEHLFLALLESFRWTDGADDDPLAAFMAGGLAWGPAPHTRAFEAGGVYVQHRGRVEKVAIGGRAYYRPDWQGVRRRAPRVVRDAGATVRASLQALGVVLEDRLVLDREGAVLDRPTPPEDTVARRPLAPDLVRGLVATVVAASAAPLAGAIRQAAADIAFEWGPVAGDLVEIGAARIRLSGGLLRALRTVLERAGSRDARLGAGLAALSEAAELVGDDLRRRAQAALAGADAARQAAALQAAEPPGSQADAAAIAAAVSALLAAADQLA